MADSPSLPPPPEIKQEIKTEIKSDSENHTDPSSHPPPSSVSSSTPLQSSSPSTSSSSFTHVLETPNTTNPSLLILQPPPSLPPPPLIQSYQPNAGTIPPPGLQFRPIPQYSSVPNPSMQNLNFQNPNVLPPGVNPGGAGAVSVSVSPLRPPGMYQGPPYQQMPNGYSTMLPGSIPPPGMLRYPNPYASMVRPPFPRPPGLVGMLPSLSRPPMPGIRGVPPIIQPVVRPVVPIVAPTEKPQTTVYIGKIASTVENDFMLSLLRLCGPVKSWKRAPESSDGTPRSFGFCEFESAEGVLRALRLLTKINADGQELVLNVNQKTREYLGRYVGKKTEREKLKETETDGTENEEETAPGVEKKEPSKPTLEDPKKDANDSAENEKRDTTQNFGVVTDEDREADIDVMDKLKNMIEERLKTKPLPPPPTLTSVDASGKSNTEVPTKSRDVESDIDIMKTDAAEDKNDDEMTSENKTTSEHDRAETSSPDKNRRHDRKSRERDRERDLKREKERELERYERERERERVRKERERDLKIQEAERLYKERVKEWESRERDREYQRQSEREREKEREREHKREVNDQEDESDDGSSRKRRRRSSMVEDKKKKRLREKEEDMADRIREEEEIAEARRRAIEEQQRKNEPENVPDQVNGGTEDVVMEDSAVEDREDAVEKENEIDSVTGNHTDDVVMTNGNSGDGLSRLSVSTSDNKQGNIPARKLGFGLVGSGKRTTVPSVFHEEDDDAANKDKKMRPLVPIDYSTEELQAVQSTAPPRAAPPNLAAAAEFAKRISTVNPKEERYEVERDINRRSGDRLSHRERERDRNDEESNHVRDATRDKTHDRYREQEHGLNKLKTPENKKLLDAKQLIDMIPRTKEELFAYDINWAVYEKHELHERMRPWISKKITEFLGEEEPTLVDYIVCSTKSHVRASQMLELLQSILDDEAEMFVLKMWRMLIFEIKKVETGLSLKTKA